MEKLILLFFCVLGMWSMANGDHPFQTPSLIPPPPPHFCYVIGLAPCIEYVRKGSKVPKPSQQCCNGLKGILDTDPQCVCAGFDLARSMNIILDMMRTTTLPVTCGFKDPGVKCPGVDPTPTPAPPKSLSPPPPKTPVPAPPMTPTPNPPSPSTPPNPTPAATPPPSGATAFSVSSVLLFACLAIAGFS